MEFIENTNAHSENPAVVFLSNANYNVTLTATSGNGSASLEKEAFILSGGYSIPFEADFNNGFEVQNWTIENEDSKTTWEIVEPDYSPTGNKAAFMNFFGYTSIGQRDNMITPAINLDGIDEPYLNFNYAYTYRFVLYDSLIIKISEDCGETWQRIYANGPNGSGIFETREALTSAFNPATPEDWCGNGYGAECVSIDLAEFGGAQNVKFMFQGYNKYGNNLYISDIEITSPSAIHESYEETTNFTIHPNPNNGTFTIDGLTNERYAYEIYNSRGHLVQSGEASGLTDLRLKNPSPGIYFVKITSSQLTEIRKIIIQ